MSTGRNPIRSPMKPPSGDTSAPTRAAVPITSAIAEARPGPSPLISSTSSGMYGRLIWIATNEIPKIRKIRRVARIGQDAAQRREREIHDPAGRHDLRADLTRAERHSSAVPTDSSAGQGKDRRERPAEAVDQDAGERGPDREADRRGGAEERDRRAQADARRHVADPGQHDPGVAELEPDEEHREGQLPGLARQRDGGEHDRLDQGAPDDDHLAAVLVGPGTPQRDEGHADDEDQGAEDPDERGPVRRRRRPSGAGTSAAGRRSG